MVGELSGLASYNLDVACAYWYMMNEKRLNEEAENEAKNKNGKNKSGKNQSVNFGHNINTKPPSL